MPKTPTTDIKYTKSHNKARAKRIMARLGLTTNTKEGNRIYSDLFTHIRSGVTDETIFAMINSKMVEAARQAEEKLRKEQEAAQIERTRSNNMSIAVKALGITDTMHRGKEILDMVKELAQHDVNHGEIVETMKEHPTVLESLLMMRAEREAFRRASEAKQAEHILHRVNMTDVLRYYAEKNGKTFAAPVTPTIARIPEAPRHISESSKTRTLGGHDSSQTQNPRTYNLPNIQVHSINVNKQGMVEAIKLVGGRIVEFRKYLYEQRITGERADVLARRFMSLDIPTKISPSPVSNTIIPLDDHAEPIKLTWSKEEKEEAREKAHAAARAAKEQKGPQHTIDPVIVNGIEYRSTWHAMQTLGIGEDADARSFRREVKAKGEEIWTHDGEQFRFELKNKRPEQVEAIQKEVQELLDVELKASGRMAEVFQRDPRAQSVFRQLVLENFGERCAVTGKHLNGVLEAAHIEGAAVDGCYNASNGVLLAPTFHKLYDRHMMGINPETMTVHFAPGIEWEEYEGKVIIPLRYRLDKDRLATRWKLFKGKKGN